uniref:Uncharacterized protein n=1 Tax=Macrostomum lignano TaxID=282301 RepID=A0A1I8FE51_9PLAT
MPFTPSHRLCTLLLCLAVLSGSSTGFLLLKEASSATTDSLTTRAVEAAAMAEAFAEAAELAAPKSATAEAAAAASAENSVAEPAHQRMPVAKRMTGSKLGRFEGEAHRRGYLPPGASDEELARLVRNLIDVYSRQPRPSCLRKDFTLVMLAKRDAAETALWQCYNQLFTNLGYFNKHQVTIDGKSVPLTQETMATTV